MVGPMQRPVRVEYPGRVELTGIRLTAAGGMALAGGAVDRLAGRIVDADDGWRDVGTAEGAEEVLARRLPAGPVDLRVEVAVAAIRASHGAARLADVTRACGLSSRTLERRFRRGVGMPPKALCRIVRFRRAWDRAAGRDGTSWADLALECGYYDQAHLLRDFRELAGFTPGRVGFLQDAHARRA
jgi:AraC-like DNA-binding protein